MKTDFNDLCSFFEKDLGWPLGEYPFEELTFSYEAQELGIREAKAAQISSIRQLRSMAASPAWNIFFVEFETKKLLVENMREVLSSLVAVKRASTAAAQRAIFAQGSLLFIVRFSTRKEPSAAFVRFQDIPNRQTPAIQIIQWSHSDPPPRLERVRKILSDHFEWPEKPSDGKAWLAQWAEGFEQTIETPEVIEKIEQYEVARLLKATLDHTPLPPQTLNALFKHIELCEAEIRKILYRTRENAVYALEIVNLLLSGKERFDRILTADRIESRERHMKFLQKSAPLLADLLISCDAISESNAPSLLTEQINEVATLCVKLGLNKGTINQSIERLLSTATGKNGAEKQWQTKEELTSQIKEMKSWLKQREKLKDVITVSSVKRIKEIADEFDDGKVEQEDLMQYAYIGLAHAMERFDWRKGDFNQYIYWPVRNAIITGIEASAFLSEVPEDLKDSAKRLQRFRYDLSQELGRTPTIQEISDASCVPEERIRKLWKYLNVGEVELHPNPQSIYGRSDLLELNHHESIYDGIQMGELRHKMMAVLDTLTDREREVLVLRFGMEDGSSRTLDEMARRFQTTPERIRQIEAKALRKLRHPVRIRKLEGFIDLPTA
jgi:RNA polymerase sigma factor (sigma-70 family)